VWSIIVHGGAGVIDPTLEQRHRSGCLTAVEAARAILEGGGDALDACCAAVRSLEDDPVFNAGIGSVLDRSGQPATDASVMRGSDLGYGAVACVVGVRHPVDLARAVLEDGRHCLLVGPGAIDFAREKRIELCDPALMITERSRTSWEKEKEGDTVGAVARDATGGIAVASSTGGTYFRLPGRVGDTPVAGAGSYARRDLGALAATGHGETMMRTVFAYAALLSLSEAGPDADLSAVLSRELDAATEAAGGKGGAIAVLPDGRVVFARNTAHMGVAWQRSGEPPGSAF
jgi:beta-aspartyl-peptidase (threonine type)